ncbi:response regulator [Chitinophaga deserti]|uniref:response regulator n=1 Tax=Chitinophaga deserti TaxID=2164099 RepID=UPI000D6B7F39|nr:response regulator [Chitinophaga deserti]
MYKRILLVDDDTDDTEIFEEALGEINPGITFYKAENGQDAFDKMMQQDTALPDLIFLDVNMPGMNGWQFLSLIKQDAGYKDIPVLMYSTSSAKRDIDQAEQLGATGFLIKPADYIGLKKALVLLLEQTTQEGLQKSAELIRKSEGY